MSVTRVGRRRGRYAQAVRVLRLLDHLSGRRYGVAIGDLAEDFGVSERQIRRDLAALEEAGHGVTAVSVGDGAGAKLIEAKGGSVRLSIRERYALLAARHVFDVLKHTPFHEDVRSIYDKISASLPPDQQQDLEAFGDRFVYLPDGGMKLYEGKDDVLDAIFTGVLKRLPVRYRYRGKAGDVRRGVLEPYALVLYRQGLYAIGRHVDDAGDRARSRRRSQASASRGDAASKSALRASVAQNGSRARVLSGGRTETHTYAIERFIEAEYVRGGSFEVPPDFSVERFFHGAFGIFHGDQPKRVIIDFRPEARSLVEARHWHRTQKLKRLENGGVRLEIEVSDLTQVAQWVIGWGPLARARAPRDLVERVAREHREAARQYRGA